MSHLGKQILQSAREQGIAVAGFDAFNLESAQAVVHAAEDTGFPVFLQVCVQSARHAGLSAIVKALAGAKAGATVDICTHYDHGPETSDPDHLAQVIDLGIESVMVDGSALPLEANITLTKQVVEIARPHGVCVEAEVGKVSRNLNATDEEIRRMMTDPDEAARLVDQTGVDYLAVSVGSISGQLTSQSTLDLERLQEIRDRVPVPLVFHGGTGIPADQLRQAIQIGVSKINIAHGIRKAFLDGMTDHMRAHPGAIDPRDVLQAGSCSARTFAVKKIAQLAGRDS